MCIVNCDVNEICIILIYVSKNLFTALFLLSDQGLGCSSRIYLSLGHLLDGFPKFKTGGAYLVGQIGRVYSNVTFYPKCIQDFFKYGL